ncbi:MAG: NAD-dependent epimerase/dehydratase family protein [Chloroflexi bacterium]|nr:NAD-dependent epimerase/dehydratase family protein [Chloroflexota bacterium]
MRKKATLITGALGEIGQALVGQITRDPAARILTLDIRDAETANPAVTHLKGDILDSGLLARIVSEYEIETIYHLAALLSTRSEFTPEAAHKVNVEGTLKLLQIAADQSEYRGQPVLFIFPSSIAAYGLPNLETKAKYAHVREFEWNMPTTMYGCNKLYCEILGGYFSQHYRQLAAAKPVMVDFRCVRFPGLISAFTVPSGGTSDYGPEMLHAAANGEPYACFVRPDTAIPFMAMPDAVKALLQLAAAPRAALSRLVYNVTSFSLAADQIRDLTLQAFPQAQITYEPDLKRQGIVDSWPIDLDDSAAHKDWGWEPEYGVERSFHDYLIPNITRRYRG